MISIILWMWGFEGPKGRYHGLYNYCPAMTNSLAAQIRRNVSIPHEIVVVSDFPADQFDPSIRYVSLQRHFGELRHMGGCYLRLKAFSAEMHDVLGPRCFWLDTDSVVVGSLDPLLCRKEPVVLLKLDTVPSTPFNGSCALWSPRETDWIWRKFDPVESLKLARAEGFKGTDQAILSMVCDPIRTPAFTYADGILSYSLHVGRRLPEHARIVTFPGRLKPDNPSVLRRATWLPEHLDAENPPSPTHLKPWTVDAQKPMRFVMQKHRPTMQDIRREGRAMLRAQAKQGA